MATPLRRIALPRRTFLRGVGAAVAIPVLDAMVPALSSDLPGGRPRRTVFVFAPNGKKMDEWTPKSRGSGFGLPPTLRALKGLHREFSVLSGLTLDGARAHGDGPGDHARAAAAFLTCAHPRKTGGSDISVGVSIDQVIAAQVGQETALPSLELGLEGGRPAGICDSGYSCAYSNNVSWRSPTTPVAKEVNPREVFRRLFGDPDDLESARDKKTRRRRTASVLDLAHAEARRLRHRVGGADRRKLDDYLDAVRAVERRLEHDEAERESVEVPVDLFQKAAADGRRGRLRLMYEMIALAFEADLTRTVTLMLGNGGSNSSYRFLGVPQGHHTLSHHGRKPEKLKKIAKIDRFNVEELARFLGRLQESKDGDKSLLYRSAVVYGSGIGDGNRHNHHDLPVLVAGRLGGALRPGKHLVFPKNTPLANLYLSLLRGMRLPAKSFADGTGPLEGV